jgi:RHS repeat-associated protein
VTDANGEVSQHVEYVPFGEVFIEELSSSAKLNTPFLFNSKELDEETGLYYYGARYYDPKTSLWLSTDPKNTVKDDKSQMSDPINIEFMNRDKHKQIHKNNGNN